MDENWFLHHSQPFSPSSLGSPPPLSYYATKKTSHKTKSNKVQPPIRSPLKKIESSLNVESAQTPLRQKPSATSLEDIYLHPAQMNNTNRKVSSKKVPPLLKRKTDTATSSVKRICLQQPPTISAQHIQLSPSSPKLCSLISSKSTAAITPKTTLISPDHNPARTSSSSFRPLPTSSQMNTIQISFAPNSPDYHSTQWFPSPPTSPTISNVKIIQKAAPLLPTDNYPPSFSSSTKLCPKSTSSQVQTIQRQRSAAPNSTDSTSTPHLISTKTSPTISYLMTKQTTAVTPDTTLISPDIDQASYASSTIFCPMPTLSEVQNIQRSVTPHALGSTPTPHLLSTQTSPTAAFPSDTTLMSSDIHPAYTSSTIFCPVPTTLRVQRSDSNTPNPTGDTSLYSLRDHLKMFKTELVQNLTKVIKQEVVGELTHLIKKESARQMVGLTRIADHLQIDEATDDIDCFPIMTEEALSSIDVQLKDNKIFQAQVKKKLKKMWWKDATSPKDLRSIVHENVLHNFNWDGRNGKKRLCDLLLFSCYLYEPTKLSKQDFETMIRNRLRMCRNYWYSKQKQ